MNTVTDAITTIQDQVVEVMKLGHERTIELVEAYVPALPFGAEQVPAVTEAVDAAFALAEKVLEANRDFTRRLLTALVVEEAVSAPTPVKRATAAA